MSEKKGVLSSRGWKDYLLQVSLILLSLFIAVGIDRCNQASKEDNLRETYYESIEADLLEEKESNEFNLADCRNDIRDIVNALNGMVEDNAESRKVIAQSLGTVFGRGVFRPFSPNTYDIIYQSGDVLLIEDLRLRYLLSANTAFRNDYVRDDLRRHDEMTLEVAEEVSPYLSLNCLRRLAKGEEEDCISDFPELVKFGQGKLSVFLRHAELRAFHLERAIVLNALALERLREVKDGAGPEPEGEVSEEQ
jgi:hypothetical protein